MGNEFGTANVNGSSEGFESFSLVKLKTPKKEGETTELVARLLPPMKSYSETGKWGFYYKQHFGYYGTNPNNPAKNRARPFACVEELDSDRNVVVACPECEMIESKRKLKQQLLNKGEDANSLNDWLFRHNLNCKVWINAMTPEGKFIVLQLTHKTVKTVLKPFLKKLDEKFNTNALDPHKGVWLKFTRTGVGRDATDKVECDTETRVLEDGTEAEVRKMSCLTPEQIQKALKICPDLAKDPNAGMVRTLSVEKIRELVNCDGDPTTVDRIFGDSKTTTASSYDADDDVDTETSSNPASTPAVSTAASVVVTTPSIDDEEAKLMAQMAALKERKARETATATVSSQNAPEDFLAQFSPK